MSFVLDSAQAVWARITPQKLGADYHDAKMVLYREGTQTACGVGQTAMGPFYCPNDEKVYLDLSFFDELKSRFGAPGEFAQAYVIAHEVGHHVQNLLGTMDKVQARMQRGDERAANALSVRLELQADCYAGVWGFYSAKRNLIDSSDVDSGLRAAAGVGDDRIQRRTQGVVVPESFTHGSAEQRARWLKTGLESGDWRDCNTFAAR
jgi:predicted metalloprotease